MEPDEPGAGLSARVKNDELPAQEINDRPNETVHITNWLPHSLYECTKYVPEARWVVDLNEAVRCAIHDNFDDIREPVTVTDGGQPECPSSTKISNLTGFQRDLLAILVARVNAGAETSGQRIKEDLEARGYPDINHGRLYPNLDDLADRGLIEKQRAAYDERTNAYRPSESGRELIEQYAAALASDVGLDTKETND